MISNLSKERRLTLAIVLATVFMFVEIAGGYWANSIAIFSDAAHLLTDIAGFGIALLATVAAKAPGTKTLTFGFARAEVFGALGSILSLWIITIFLLIAAYDRAMRWMNGDPEPVDGFLMFGVACFGVLVNICLGWVFHEEHGGEFHPGHSHEHGHCEHHGSTGSSDHVHSHGHSHGHDGCSGHDHGHDHGRDHEHGHDHGHGHDHSSERTPLVQPHNSKSYQGCDGHDHGHGHGHSHSSATTVATQSDDHVHEGHGHSHPPSDVNIEAAYLHVLTDLIQSIGVAIAGLVMWKYPHFEIIDPMCTLVFSCIALHSTLPLIHRVSVILFEGAPSHIDWEIVMERLSNIPGVENVHDLHIWSISSKSISLTCHIRAQNPQTVLQEAHKVCRGLGIDHATIQVHDSADKTFCYSQTCDWEHSIDVEAPNAASSRNNLCVSTRA